jgi:hypothetical protein
MAEERIIGVVPSLGRVKFMNLFGYSTRGIPGLEIVGMGNRARTVKEKITFLSRQQEASLSLNRFVLGVDPIHKKEKEDGLDFLELPLLILYWSLMGWIPLKSLKNCFSSGRVYPGGALIPWTPQIQRMKSSEEGRLWITSRWMQSPKGFFPLPLEELIQPRQIVYIPPKSQIERAFAKST